MTDRNRELVPDNWSLVRERALTTGLCSEGWYSEHSGVCRITLPVQHGSVKDVRSVMHGTSPRQIPEHILMSLAKKYSCNLVVYSSRTMP